MRAYLYHCKKVSCIQAGFSMVLWIAFYLKDVLTGVMKVVLIKVGGDDGTLLKEELKLSGE